MERIKLSKQEKEVLRIVKSCGANCPSMYPLHVFNTCVHSLKRKGLVDASFVRGGNTVWTAKVSVYGRLYLIENPNLRNPIPWKAISVIIALLAFIVSIIALFVSCSKL